MPLTLSEVLERLANICSEGYIRSHRSGSTGIGKTLEDLLEIQENNIAAPDLDRIELKAQRENSSSQITLITLDRKAWQIRQAGAVREFGIPDNCIDGRINLYATVSIKESQQGFRLQVTPSSVELWYRHQSCLAIWNLDSLAAKFNEKIRHILLVTAKVQNRSNVEHFWFNRAVLMMGYMTPDYIASAFECECLKIDLRLHLGSNGRVRNHGTGFRILEKNWDCLFRSNQEFDLQNPSTFSLDRYHGYFD